MAGYLVSLRNLNPYRMKSLFTIALFFIVFNSFAQAVKIYDPEADVTIAISQGLIRAKAENKHLFLQIGGYWCPWCLKFHKFCATDSQIDSIMSKDFIAIKVNYSKENRNLETLKKLEFPQRFGFPVFVILDASGKRIHTQSSSYLEEGENYSKKRVFEFLKQWSPEALNPNHYTTK